MRVLDDHGWQSSDGEKEWSVVEMSESMDEATASDEVNMIATNIERLKIKSELGEQNKEVIEYWRKIW